MQGDESLEGFLLDTNVISEAIKKHPNRHVMGWLDVWDISQTFISVMTIGEIRKGIELIISAQKRPLLESWLDKDIRKGYADRILPVDFRVAEYWGKITAKHKNHNSVDMIFAATALTHNLTLVTRNTKHFAIPGLRVMNPWNE